MLDLGADTSMSCPLNAEEHTMRIVDAIFMGVVVGLAAAQMCKEGGGQSFKRSIN